MQAERAGSPREALPRVRRTESRQMRVLLLTGEFRAPMTDGTVITVVAGEAYYLPPGHRFEVVEDCEYVEFSPTKELEDTYAVVARNQGAD